MNIVIYICLIYKVNIFQSTLSLRIIATQRYTYFNNKIYIMSSYDYYKKKKFLINYKKINSQYASLK